MPEPESPRLTHPWLVAAWPGMGHVALNAAVYLLAKLHMSAVAEFDAPDLFDVMQVEVKGGLIQPARRPRNRLFAWKDPNGRHDLVVFLGEAQPPLGKYPFCRQLIEYAKSLGVERVITFAAMATDMRPGGEHRVFAAATDQPNLKEIRKLDLTILDDAQIGGLNGVLLSAAAENGLHGACLLGEMPHDLTRLPCPQASLVVLEVFAKMSGIDIDLAELEGLAGSVETQLGDLVAEAERAAEEQEGEDAPDEAEEPEFPAAEPGIDRAAAARIERLFTQAAKDRSKAFDLKQELDRLGLFKEYEDRFLDLFKKRE